MNVLYCDGSVAPRRCSASSSSCADALRASINANPCEACIAAERARTFGYGLVLRMGGPVRTAWRVSSDDGDLVRVRYVDAGGVTRVVGLAEAVAVRFEDVRMARIIPAYRNQGHTPGRYWSATTGELVEYESFLESKWPTLLDFDPHVVRSVENRRQRHPACCYRRQVGLVWCATARCGDGWSPAVSPSRTVGTNCAAAARGEDTLRRHPAATTSARPHPSPPNNLGRRGWSGTTPTASSATAARCARRSDPNRRSPALCRRMPTGASRRAPHHQRR